MGQIAVWLCIVIAVLAAAIAGSLAFFLGFTYRKNKAEAEIGSAEQEAKPSSPPRPGRKKSCWKARMNCTALGTNRKRN